MLSWNIEQWTGVMQHCLQSTLIIIIDFNNKSQVRMAQWSDHCLHINGFHLSLFPTHSDQLEKLLAFKDFTSTFWTMKFLLAGKRFFICNYIERSCVELFGFRIHLSQPQYFLNYRWHCRYCIIQNLWDFTRLFTWCYPGECWPMTDNLSVWRDWCDASFPM